VKIYVASSWRNEHYPEVVRALKAVSSFDVYDFREDGFSWSDAGVDGQQLYNADQMNAIHRLPECRRGFDRDITHVNQAEATVLVLPAGRSAHLELGVAIGRGQYTVIYMPEPEPPDLMWAAANRIVGTVTELLLALGLSSVQACCIAYEACEASSGRATS
jgi:hypothetical protein